MIAEQHLKRSSSDNGKRTASSSASSKGSKIRKLLSSLDSDDVPVDKAAECTFAQDEHEPMTWDEINDGIDSENDHNEWLEKVASQLGARPMLSRNSSLLSSDIQPCDSDIQPQMATSRPMSRNSVLSSDGKRDDLELWESKMAAVQSKEQKQPSLDVSQCKGSKTENPEIVPSSVLVSHETNLSSPQSGGAIRTLIDIDKGSRHEYLVVNKDDPERIVGEVLIEGKMGWVEVSFGGDELVKCRSSRLLVLPKYKYSIGDVVPKEYIAAAPDTPISCSGPDDSKSWSSGDRKACDKKPFPRSKSQYVDINDIFYWACECEAFNIATDRVCQACKADRNSNAKASKLLEVAEEVVNSDFVSSLEEAIAQIPEFDRDSIPELILAQLLEAKVAGMNLSQSAAKPCTKIDSYFYWSCGSCTTQNSYKKGFCQICREARGYFARSSPLFSIAESIALESRSPEDTYAKWPAHTTKQIPEVVMDSLITCVHIIRRKGDERRCRNRKIEGLDYCQDHCEPALLTASRADNTKKQADMVGSDAGGGESSTEPVQRYKLPMGIEALKQSLHTFLTTKIDYVKNKLGWSVNDIEDSLICDSDSKPFPLGLKVRTYFLGYGFHDGRIVKVRRQFKDERPVLVYRVVYNDGDQQDYLHHNIASLRQCYDINNIDPEDDVEQQIPPGTLFELKSGVVVEVIDHMLGPQNEPFISFTVEDESNSTVENLDLSLLKFQLAVKRRVCADANEDRAAGSAAAEWPVSHDRIDPECCVGNGLQYRVCNGMYLLGKAHNVDYSSHDIQKLPNVDDPRDARPGVKMPRYDPANIYNYTHWDPSQCLVCELCGIDKDDNQGENARHIYLLVTYLSQSCSS